MGVGPATAIVVGVFFAAFFVYDLLWKSPLAISLPILLVSIGAITLALLPRVKGGWVGLLYALDVTDRDDRLHTGDTAD